MTHSVEHHMELESRERTFLRYEAAFWGVAFAACAVGAAFLAVSALTASGGIIATMGAITLGVGALFTYFKRDEVREEYRLKVRSGHDKIAWMHGAEQLELGKHRTHSTARHAQPQTEQNIVPQAVDIPASDKIIENAAQKVTPEPEKMVETAVEPTQARADGQQWSDITSKASEQATEQTISK